MRTELDQLRKNIARFWESIEHDTHTSMPVRIERLAIGDRYDAAADEHGYHEYVFVVHIYRYSP
jgi:hypothetical protein